MEGLEGEAPIVVSGRIQRRNERHTQVLSSQLPDLRHNREPGCHLLPDSASFAILGAQGTIYQSLASSGWRHRDAELQVLTETESGAEGLSNLLRVDMR